MSFSGPPEAYDDYMGRYSRLLSPQLSAFAGVRGGLRVLDVGCGPGALTALLVAAGADVAAVEPSAGYAAACAARNPTADVRTAAAEALPWPAGTFDVVVAQLVLHFLADPVAGAREMARVARPGATVAACTWDTGGRMGLHEVFWGAVEDCGLPLPAERGRQRLGTADELRAAWAAAGLGDVEVAPLDVEVDYADEGDFWRPFTGATGPTGVYVGELASADRDRLRAACAERLTALGLVQGDGSVRVPARSWAVRGRTSTPVR